MSYIYRTVQGDTWDGMAYRFYGSEKYMKNLIEANWPYTDTLVFSDGVELTVPDLPEEENDNDMPIWRRSSSEDSTS